MSATASLPAPADRRFWLWRSPLLVLAAYCLISLFLRENYPFTHYPMYSNPSAERSYYVVADAVNGEPLPIADLTDITCPKIGKIWRTKASELSTALKKNKNDFTVADKQSVGLAIFKQLRGYAKEKNRTLPDKLQLSRVDIGFEDGKVVETPEILAKEMETPAPNAKG
jgi:hypothetical protein